MGGISFSPEAFSLEGGLLAGAFAFFLVPVIQQLFAVVARWGKKKPVDGDLWGSYDS
jgi:hypothetical protein